MCPPLARELAINLKLNSLTFQRLFFLCIMRRIWPVNDLAIKTPFEEKALAIFSQNQMSFRRQTLGQHQNQTEGQTFHRGRLQILSFKFNSLQLPNFRRHNLQIPRFKRHNLQILRFKSLQTHTFSTTIQHHLATALKFRVSIHHSIRWPSSNSPVHGLGLLRQIHEERLYFHLQDGNSLYSENLTLPVLRAKTISSPLYIFQDGFMRRPERPSNPSLSVEKWNFTVCREDMNRLPRSNCAGGEVAREIDQNSKLIRLRCIKWGKPEDPSDAAWAAADTKWIPRSYFSLNGHHLEQRKKLHHGKDMPIDITDLVTEGENTLEFTVLTSINDTAHHAYSIGVETVGVATHDSIRGQVTNQNYVPSEKVLAAIQDQLSKSTNDDDDIAVVSDSTLTITLFDPFYQSRFCDIPKLSYQRGRARQTHRWRTNGVVQFAGVTLDRTRCLWMVL
ncbi:hypothetical protein TUN199_06259 [Pyrenophora tritici-repentis]|nr:hypothetical protein Alg130_06122 [Pyrenophora tritici-repentis]KAI0621754.1 hypothetical protein TUN199_06259 [Pyrenophora tritici-repentis]